MNIKKLAIFLSALLVSCVFCNNSFAQSQTRSRAIYGELLETHRMDSAGERVWDSVTHILPSSQHTI